MTSDPVILLVEDTETDVVLTARALKKIGTRSRLVVVRNGMEAVDYLFCQGTWIDRDKRLNPALILLDLELPKLDGLEVLRRMRADEKLKDVPVVVFTASENQEDIFRSYNSGANSFVRKPKDMDQYTTVVQELVGQFLPRMEVPAAQTSGTEV